MTTIAEMARLRMVSAARSNSTAVSMTASMMKLRCGGDLGAGDEEIGGEPDDGERRPHISSPAGARRNRETARSRRAAAPMIGAGDQRHVQAGDRDDVVEAGAPQRLVDVLGNAGADADDERCGDLALGAADAARMRSAMALRARSTDARKSASAAAPAQTSRRAPGRAGRSRWRRCRRNSSRRKNRSCPAGPGRMAASAARAR